jgi:predicted ArsR family transcriptional regulator
MLGPTKTDRFFESTRGKIVTLLRQSGMTADEVAQALGLTDNAVRAHLTTLERDGLVRPNGVRHEGKVGKPATIYQLSPDVEPLFSKAYLPLLTVLVGTLGERLRKSELTSLFREAGRRLAASAGPPDGNLGRRVRVASELLNRLGGLTTVEELAGGTRYVIRGSGCPLGIAVAERPEVCQVVGGLIEEVTGARVQSCCARGERPSCCFEAMVAEQDG